MSEIINSTYEVIGKLGSGGGGKVYLARHLRLDKMVVLKVDRRQLNVRKEWLRREVDILKNLSHPYIPQVYDFIVEDGQVITVMEFIDGESLDKPLKQGVRFSQPQIIKWTIQLLEALSYLHSPTHGDPPRGYVHSDVKPANLMLKPDGNICLIDFNISLVLGEKNVVGCSAGYSSPEHYGLDFSNGSGTIITDGGTVFSKRPETEVSQSGKQPDSRVHEAKVIVPDARSDIYSVGATLYHFVSGIRPTTHVAEIVPLSKKEFNPQLVDIITKAMNPNPDQRYQTAEEMLAAVLAIREQDPRVKRLRRMRRITAAASICVLALGLAGAFVGLKRMQTVDRWKSLAAYAEDALAEGDTKEALTDVLKAIPQKTNLLTPGILPEVETALASVTGVYDLSDDFKVYRSVELPSEALGVVMSPDETTAACLYQGGVAIVDTASAEILVTLETDASALSEVQYLDADTLLYASADGITAYDLTGQKVLWTGEKATNICVSADGSVAAAIYKEESQATVYQTSDGAFLAGLDFENHSQTSRTNENFANLDDYILALDADGSKLAVSFSDGFLEVIDIGTDERMQILESDSGYTHMEGGFYGQYFAFSASGESQNLVAVIDTEQKTEVGGFSAEDYCSLTADENGILLRQNNILVRMDPVTGDQTPLVETSGNIVAFDVSDSYTIISSDEDIQIFNENAECVSESADSYCVGTDYVQIGENLAVIGNLDSSQIHILKYESHADADVLLYDASYEHDEARVSSDGTRLTLFSYKGFRVYGLDGELCAETEIPNADDVYDQQYVRSDTGDCFEVIYEDGTVDTYQISDGTQTRSTVGEAPDTELYGVYETDNLRFEAPLHGSVTVYEKESGEQIAELSEEAYLTYVTQVPDGVILQYMTSEGEKYGVLMNESCETLAKLPNLCDVDGETLYFDYGTGSVRKTVIYQVEELQALAETMLSAN